jgi:hypothetical protein
MTLYLSFRAQSVGGAVKDASVLMGDGTTQIPSLTLMPLERIGALIADKNIIFGAHGFNVSYEEGCRSLGRLEPQLKLASTDVFLGVLWPGDYWLPVVNYPFEGDVAMDCGRRLARFCKQYLSRALSFSFISHSLGARVVLEAVKYLDRPARTVCLTAAAVNRDCLTTEYTAAFANASTISVLASREDMVLKLAFPVGDPIADLLHDDHTPFQIALGYTGPPQPIGATVPPWQIPDDEDFGHSDYLPPSDAGAPARTPAAAKWPKSAGFMGRALRRENQTWP